jgi:hypothetical protein
MHLLLVLQLDQLAEQHIRLQTENREHMTQVQYLQGQVLNKDDEVQKHQVAVSLLLRYCIRLLLQCLAIG